ncbi:ArsR/SmtB family transcription factor [Thermostilla marina]
MTTELDAPVPSKAGVLDAVVSPLSAMADRTRMRILCVLWTAGEAAVCHCQLVDLLGLAGSTVSRHLRVLRQAGLIDVEQRGRWSFFRLSESLSDFAADVLQHAVEFAEHDAQIVDDRRRIHRMIASRSKEHCR